MLAQDNKSSNYVRSFANVKLPSIESILALAPDEKTRPIRKIQIYWAILKKAGFQANETRLRGLGLTSRNTKHFDPHFNNTLRTAAFLAVRNSAPPVEPQDLDALVAELEVISRFRRENSEDTSLQSGNKPMFDSDDVALLEFLNPASGSGPSILRGYMPYHAPDAGDFIADILAHLDDSKTVILDLGNATDQIRRYFADMLSKAVFGQQERKFVENTLGEHFVQLYFEEAHNLFPPESKDLTGVYARFAKEGAKFHIGIVYSTQSPSTINGDLLAQTENFFVGHLSSQDETKSLSRVRIAFSGIEEDILRAKTPGYMRMLTMSHRFVIPVQTHRFEAVAT
jgi:hypothetical protein